MGDPADFLGNSDEPSVALLVALKRPDLARRVVFASGVFHARAGAAGALDPDDETVAFLVDYWVAVGA